MEQTKRLCQIDVQVTQLKVEIRFPCQITYSVRLGNEEIQSEQNSKLKDYKTSFSNKVTISGEIDYDERYLSKLGILNVYVISGSRKNIVGTLEFDIAEILNGSGTAELETQLIRCLDKNSSVKLRINARPLGSKLMQTQNFNVRSLVDSKDSSVDRFGRRQDSTLHKRQRSITTNSNENNFMNQRMNRSFASSFKQGQNRCNSSRQKRAEREESEKKSYIKEIQSLKNQINYLKSSNQLKESKIIDVPNSTRSLQTQLKVLKISKDELEKSFKDSKRSLQESFTKNSFLQTEIGSVTKKLELKQSFYLEQLKRANQRVNELENTKSQLNRQLVFLKDDQTSNERKWSFYEKEKQKIEEDKQVLKKQNNQLLDEIKHLNEQFILKNQELSQRTNELTQKLHEIDYLKAVMRTKQSQTHSIGQQTESLRRQTYQLRIFNQELEQLIKNKDKQIRGMSEQLEIFSGRVQQFGKVNESLQSLLVSTTNKLQAQTALSSSNTQTISIPTYHATQQLTPQAQNLYEQIQQLSKMNNQLQQSYSNELSLIRSDNNQLSQQLHYYRSIVTQEQQEKFNISSDFQNISSQYNQICQQLTASVQRSQQLQVSLNEKYNAIEQLQKQIENLEFTVDNYKTLFKRDNNKLEQTLINLTQLESQNLSLSAAVDHLKKVEQTVNQKEVLIKTQENNILALELSKQQLSVTISHLQQQNYNILQQLSDIKNHKQIIRQTNNNIGQKLQEHQNNYLELRFKFKNLEFENTELKRKTSASGGVQDEYRRYKQSVERVVRKYRETILVDQNDRQENNLISELLWQCKQSTTDFIIQLRQQYQFTISNLQCQLNHLRQHTPSYNNITQQLSQVQTDNNYNHQVASVKQQLLMTELRMLREEVERLNQQLTRTRSQNSQIVERSNIDGPKVQQLTAKIQEMEKYIFEVEQQKNNLFFEFDRMNSLARERNSDVNVVKGQVESNNEKIKGLIEELNWERNKGIDLVEQINRLKKQLDSKVSSQREYSRRIQQTQNRSALQQASNKQNKSKFEGQSKLQIQKLKKQSKLQLETLRKENRTLTDQIKTLKTIQSLQVQTVRKPVQVLPPTIMPLQIHQHEHHNHNHVKTQSSFIINNYNQSQLIPLPQYKHSHGNQFFHHNTHPVPTTAIQQQYFDCQSRYQTTINELLQDKLVLEESLIVLKQYITNYRQNIEVFYQNQLQQLKNKLTNSQRQAEATIFNNNRIKNQELSNIKYQLLRAKQHSKRNTGTGTQVQLQTKQGFISQSLNLYTVLDEIYLILKTATESIPQIIDNLKDTNQTGLDGQVTTFKDNILSLVNSVTNTGVEWRRKEFISEKAQGVQNNMKQCLDKIVSLTTNVSKFVENKTISVQRFKQMKRMLEGRQYQGLKRAIDQVAAV